jgi:hypothetical protein
MGGFLSNRSKLLTSSNKKKSELKPTKPTGIDEKLLLLFKKH